MSKHRTVILKRDTRALTRSALPFTNTLSNVGIIWFRKGDRLELGETLKMNYDHDTKTVVRLILIGIIPDYFIIESELEIEDPEFEQYTTVE